jgi:tRNA (guanine-N7-)-methyltransferase
MGKATAQIALDNPDKNYLGLEVYKNGIGQLLGAIQRLHLRNLYLIEWDALEVLADQIPDNSLAGFHIFFPDPWPKTRHHKRRLMQRPNTDLLAAKLTTPGYLYFVTDWQPYAESAKLELDATPTLKNRYPTYAPPQLWRPETKFESKGKQANHEIYELVYDIFPLMFFSRCGILTRNRRKRIMATMTEQEADTLDERVTKNPPKVDPSKARHALRMLAIDDFTAEYLLSLSIANNKSPTQLVAEMVLQRVALSG